MLEIVFLVFLSRRIAKKSKEKGLKSGWFVAMLIALWVTFEVTGIIVGALITQGEGLLMYAFGIIGAALGALVSFLIVSSIKPKLPVGETLDSNLV